MPDLDIILRLGAAALIGGAIGLNRDLHHKPSGLRTLSLVALGSALATLAVSQSTSDPTAISRVIQGLITGVGFLGAGVIIHDSGSNKVHGLTTAASIWVTACLGAVCGMGYWSLVVSASMLIALILLTGKSIEKTVHKALDRTVGPPSDIPSTAPAISESERT